MLKSSLKFTYFTQFGEKFHMLKFNVFIWFCLLSLLCVAQQTNIGYLNVRNIPPKEYKGLPQTFQAIEDHRGVLYITNNMGVYSYDGSDWKLHKIKDDAAAVSLDKAQDGKIYVGTRDSEFGYFDLGDNELVYTSLSDSIVDVGQVYHTLNFEKFVAFQSRTEIFVYNKETLKVSRHKFETTVGNIVNFGNQLVVFTKNGVFAYEDQQYKKYSRFGLGERNDLLGGIMLDVNNYIVYSKTQVIHINPKGSLHIISEEIQEPTYSIKINEDKFVISTAGNGAYYFSLTKGLLEIFNKNYGLQNQHCKKPLLTSHNELVIPTEYGFSIVGLGSKLRVIDERSGFKGNVENICRTTEQITFAGNEGLYTMQNNHLKKNPSVRIEAWDALKLDANKFLVAQNDGIYIVKDEKEEKIINCYPWCLYRSKIDSNYIFVGLDPGLMVLKNGDKGWMVDTVFEVSEAYRYIDEDNNGNLWMASSTNGVGHFKPNYVNFENTIVHYSGEKYGLNDGDLKPVFNGEKMYFASFGNGLLEFDSKTQKFNRTTDFGDKIAQFDKAITRVDFDKNGRLWANLAYSAAEHEFGYVDENKVWNKNEFTEIHDMTMSIDASGDAVWIGTSKNIFYYDLNENDLALESQQSTLIGEIKQADSIFVKEFSLLKDEDQVITVAFNKEALYFRFSRPQFALASGVEYSYFMEGWNDHWSDWDEKNRAGFTNLPEGKYTFKVKSRINNSAESQISELKLIVLPPWYRTWWAYFLYAISLIVIVWLVIRWRTRALQIRQRELENTVEQRTKEVVIQKTEAEKQRDIVALQHHEITSSINYASRIQEAVLTSDEYLNSMFDNYFVFYKPRDIVSGDFYWAHESKDGKKIWAAADCTGHGVPGGFMSMLGMSFLNEIVIENKVTDAHEILNQLRHKIIKAFEKTSGDSERKDGMDIGLCVLNAEGTKIQFAGAYNPLFVIRKSEKVSKEILDNEEYRILEEEGYTLIEIKADKMPVGKHILDATDFVSKEFTLEKEDVLYTFSDGLIDQFGGEKGKKYMVKRFKKKLLSCQDKSMSDQRALLENEFKEWMRIGDTEQIDDVCVIGVHLR